LKAILQIFLGEKSANGLHIRLSSYTGVTQKESHTSGANFLGHLIVQTLSIFKVDIFAKGSKTEALMLISQAL